MIERLRKTPRVPARAVMFDFDGTLGLVRAGWMPLMLDMMMETLGPLGGEPVALRAEATEYVARLAGNAVIHQMNAFADHVRALGGEARPGEEYKSAFIQAMGGLRDARLREAAGDALLVPGARALLAALRERGLKIYLASGTDHAEICQDARLLDIAQYFDGIYGSAATSLTKRELLARIVVEGTSAEAILTFGDGRVEIEETKAVGGTAIGLATDEAACLAVDLEKRRWLIDAGADYILPNYLDKDLLALVEGRL